MKYCTNCGREMHDNAPVCLNCGTVVNGVQEIKRKSTDRRNGWFTLIGVFYPEVAIVMYIVLKCIGMPNRAHSFGKGALIGGIIGSVVVTLYLTYAALLASLAMIL